MLNMQPAQNSSKNKFTSLPYRHRSGCAWAKKRVQGFSGKIWLSNENLLSELPDTFVL